MEKYLKIIIILLILFFCPAIIIFTGAAFLFVVYVPVLIFGFIYAAILDKKNKEGEITPEQRWKADEQIRKIGNRCVKKFPELFDYCDGKAKACPDSKQSVEVVTNKYTIVYVGKPSFDGSTKPESASSGKHFILSGSKEYDFEKGEHKKGRYYGISRSVGSFNSASTYTFVNLADVDRVEKIKKKK